jgi:hypothetical protein
MRYVTRAHFCAGRYIGDCRDTGTVTFIDATSPTRAWRLLDARPFRDYKPDPINKRHSGLSQRPIEMAELKVRVGIHKTRQQCDRSEVSHVFSVCLGSNLDDPVVVDRYDAELNRRRVNGKDHAGLERKRHDAIVAEFARILPTGQEAGLLQVQL